MEQDDSAAQVNQDVTLTIKSLKPPLTFTLACSPTATISSLKAQLKQSEQSAPAPETQRWILKGKAMNGDRLLKEFNVEDGSVVNLMIVKAAPAATAATSGPPPAETTTSTSVPSFTLSEPVPVSSAGPPSLQINTTSLPIDDGSLTPSSEVPQFNQKLSDPALWSGAWELLQQHFGEGHEGEAQRAWECWLGGAREWISPGDKALIRSKVGLSAMGGV